MNRFLVLLIVSMGFATAARAEFIPATWTDTMSFGVTLSDASAATKRVTYTHDITDHGFRPLVDEVDNFALSLWLTDDDNVANDGDTARVDLNFLGLGLLGGDFQTTSFGLVGAEFGGWALLGWAQLNVFGTLTVTLSAWSGDFNLLGSQLTAYGSRQTTVPEPGTLALLGIGLLGMALSLRRRPLNH
jgi:hypothetical protein